MDVTTPEKTTCRHCGLDSVYLLLRRICPWCGTHNTTTEDL